MLGFFLIWKTCTPCLVGGLVLLILFLSTGTSEISEETGSNGFHRFFLLPDDLQLL
jgi:hypothetical protein